MDGSSFLASFKSSASSSKDMIQFSGAIDSFPIKGDEVNIVPSCGDHEMGSSKLQTSNIVNYGWDFQYCHGQLVAVHKSGSYFAYGLVSPGKSTGMVRVVQKKTDQRVLIKGMKGKVKDLAFAHCIEEIILGIVDEFGNLFVAKIEQTNEEDSDNDKPLQTELVLQINNSETNPKEGGETHRIFWCPFLPEEENTDDSSSKLLLLTHGSSAEIWNVDLVIKDLDSNIIDSNDVPEAGKLVVNDHGDTIMDASFSPDGTALATASADGQVKFFQVYMKGSESPRRLHQWKPHDGQPVSCLFFLDNHRDHNPDQQIWKYALTGCCQNNELKLWSCENWTCLQTVAFNANDGKRVALQAVMDITAQYLLLSDINRKNVYVLQLQHDHANDKVKFVSVSEFATPSPLLSMAMLEAGVKKVTDKHTLDDSDDEDDDDLQAESREATVINFLLVQPKSLQECRIVYEDAFSQPQINLEAVKKEVITPTEELKEAADKITLMSPEVFVATKIKEEPVTPQAEKEPVLAPRRGQAVVAISGGSSPSREVQDILGDTEAEGGLGAEVVITEEDDEDDLEEEDITDDPEAEDSDELSNMLDKCNESIKKEALDPLAVKLQEGLRIKQEAGLRIKEEKESPSSSNSAWRGVKTEPTCWPIKPEPASPVLAGASSGTSIDMILHKLNDMTHMIQTQRSEMQMLKEEMKHMHREDLTIFRSLLEESNREAVGELKTTTGILVNSIKGNLKNSINEEIRKATPLLVQAAHQSIQEALAKEVHGKVLKSDLHLKDAIAKLASNRAVSEGIANNVATSLSPSLHASFKDALISTLVPAFERTIQTLFGQLSNTFNKGLKDYESQLKSHVNKQLDPVIRDLKDKSKTSTDLEKKLTNVIRSEMRNITSTPHAGSPATPSPAASLTSVVNIEADIKQKLMEGKVNEAFSTALTANSLPIVVSTCEKVNPNQIFHQNPCPLSQEVLLSLIQQLAHNLESYTDLKLNYLNEAVPSLEPGNESTKQYIPNIMSGVLDQLTKFARSNPNKKVKMLMMAVQGLTKDS